MYSGGPASCRHPRIETRNSIIDVADPDDLQCQWVGRSPIVIGASQAGRSKGGLKFELHALHALYALGLHAFTDV
ncbi:hypothetical protein FIBSPDRAFT_860586 [Athelia psychrophila]|uniref:Uncharacterized protein n=1 Tax=Athelia psychrophila TaxID=1759441 RepID=A0A166K041_9AGAM|nr:hypothetical protein FIBSPDRAFT_860586 [Fibularhizoctonia sp. CBS 109695]